MTTQASTLTPGLAGVRARIAEQTREAKRIADTLALSKTPHVDDSATIKLRVGLYHIAGRVTLPPEQPTIDALIKLGLVKLADPEVAPVCGRYRPTDLGAEVLGLIGVRG